jgi:formyl-CoA transferase
VLEVVGRSELAEDPRFASRAGRQHNHHELQAILQSAFETAPRDHWLALLEAEDVPCAPLNTLDEVVADPQVQHLGMVQEVAHPQEGPMRVLGSGVIFSATPTTLSAAPVLDEHRAEILAELGLPADYLQEPDGQGKLE